MRTTLVCLMVVLGTPAAGPAAEVADFPAERFQLAVDRNGIVDVESADVGVPLALDLAVVSSYAHNPLVLFAEDANGRRERVGVLVGHRVGMSLVGAVTLLPRLRLGVELPFTLYQGRGEGLGAELGRLDALGVAGSGDLRLVPKLQLLSALRFDVDLTLMPVFSVPSGFPRDSYLGDRSVTASPMLAASRAFGALRLALNAGYRWRAKSEMLDLEVGPEVLYRLGAAYSLADVLDRPLEVGASVSGATAARRPFRDRNTTPLELVALASYEVLGDFMVFGGGGSGVLPGFGAPDFRVVLGLRYSPRESDRDQDRLLDDQDACPKQPEDHDGFEDDDGCPDADNDRDGREDVVDDCRDEAEDKDGFEDDDGCPEADNDKDGVADAGDRCPNVAEDDDDFADDDGCPELDNDQDGIEDAHDKCPDDAEDKDGFADDDGCADPDNDRDGFADAQDKCPDAAEVINGVDDEDGCPDVGESKVEMTATKINIKDKVYFDTGKATIKAKSHGLLAQVAAILKANPQVTKIRVEGHTDDRGDDKRNLELSQARAEAVAAFLIGRGIAASRVEAAGFGETRPIASNKKESGRELNRRVEFVITEVDGKPSATDAAP
ncbi:MAG: OmpA family protein [Deltaproteobacteria bacterium]|nr:OmpA family protein [Deltaproteobacteria bacterium]